MATAPLVRLPWIDHVRTFVILLVVNLHACVSYSHVGDWYFMSAHEPTLAEKVPFIVWMGHLQAFFMGLLFFISGFCAQGSLERRGPERFARERIFRLGLPALLYALAIHPFILLVLNPWNHDFGPPGKFYLNFLTSGRFLGATGPLWFAVALLFFSLALALWRSLRPASQRDLPSPAHATSHPLPGPGPSSAVIGLFALTLGLITFAVRLVQPIGTNVLNLQLCFFVQYVAFFIVGLQAASQGWLLPLAASARARWAGWLALCGGPPVQIALMVTGMKTGKLEDFFGGWHWQALGYALWEQAVGVGLSLGVLAFFSRRLDFDGPRARWLADRSFGVYVLHAPLLVALALGFRALSQNLYALVALLTLTGLVTSFLLADLLRRVPGLRAIL